jgi:hypothetical protein
MQGSHFFKKYIHNLQENICCLKSLKSFNNSSTSYINYRTEEIFIQYARCKNFLSANINFRNTAGFILLHNINNAFYALFNPLSFRCEYSFKQFLADN